MAAKRLEEVIFFIRPFFSRFIAASLLVYLLFHLVYGKLGIISYLNIQNEVGKSYAKLEELRSERCVLENETKSLRPGSLDLDLLVEVA